MQVLQQINTNHDGIVQLDELLASYEKVPKKDDKEIEELRRAFKYLSGESKLISREQLNMIIKETGSAKVDLTCLDFNAEDKVDYNDVINKFYILHRK